MEKEFQQFLKESPLVAYCLEDGKKIPYEYSSNMIRYQRFNLKEVLTKLPKLTIFCIKNNIPIYDMEKIRGGNLKKYVASRKYKSKI